ncbi:hypothetical protein LEMLEM_LOCUS14423, partial [Lemmus lemmus]
LQSYRETLSQKKQKKKKKKKKQNKTKKQNKKQNFTGLGSMLVVTRGTEYFFVATKHLQYGCRSCFGIPDTVLDVWAFQY